MQPALSITGVAKTYGSGFTALKPTDLTVRRGEVFALLGPNGAGKTTLIGICCGLVRPSAGRVLVDGHDIAAEYRAARSRIGLVPQELSTDAFESVTDTVAFSRGLFGKPRDPAVVERVLRELSLWDKRDAKIVTLSGGMKRRLLIAKALVHEPTLLFLDEPTAGVDVELRRDMWALVRRLRAEGVTVVLTTHYIEEAEEMADRVGVIDRGELILVEGKAELMRKLGSKRLHVTLAEPLGTLPPALARDGVALAEGGRELVFTYDTRRSETGIDALLSGLRDAGATVADLRTEQSSLEDIFVRLLASHGRPDAPATGAPAAPEGAAVR